MITTNNMTTNNKTFQEVIYEHNAKIMSLIKPLTDFEWDLENYMRYVIPFTGPWLFIDELEMPAFDCLMKELGLCKVAKDEYRYAFRFEIEASEHEDCCDNENNKPEKPKKYILKVTRGIFTKDKVIQNRQYFEHISSLSIEARIELAPTIHQLLIEPYKEFLANWMSPLDRKLKERMEHESKQS